MSSSVSLKICQNIRNILNISDNLCFLVDEQKKIIFANKKALKALGYEKNEVLNKDLHSIFGLNIEELNKFQLQKSYPNLNQQSFQKLKTRNGEHISISTKITSLEEPDGRLWLFKSTINVNDDINKVESKEKDLYKDFLDFLPEMVCESNLKGDILLANKYALEKLGYTEDDLSAGIKLSDVFFPGEFKRAKAYFFKKINGTHHAPQEYLALCKNGKTFPVIADFMVTFTKSGRPSGLRGLMIDISSRKDKENELAKEKAYLEDLIESAPEAIVQTENGKIKRINNEFSNMFGYNTSEVFGKNIDQLITRDNYTEADSITKLIYRGKKVFTEGIRYHKNGKAIDVSILGTPISLAGKQIGTYGIYRDISARKKSEKVQNLIQNISTSVLIAPDLGNLLNSVKKELSTILDTTNFFIAFYNKNNHSLSFPFFEDQNDKFETVSASKTITGYVISSNKPVLLRTEDITQLEKTGEIDLIGTPSKIWLGVPLKTGNEVFGVISLQSYDDDNLYDDEDLNILIFISNQISLAINKLRVEDTLKIAKVKAEQAAIAKEQFLSTMSHEIRTPLNAVIGMSQLLLSKNPREDQMEFLEALKFSGENLLSLINEVLDYSKIESQKIILEKIEINPEKLVSGVFKILKINADQRNNKLILKLDKNVPDCIIGDKVRLNQIITNLVGNAIKFTDNGQIGVEIKLESETENGYVLKFAVTDTGIGIEKSKLDYIFESFTQEKSDITRLYGGTGLGLTITKKLINLQKGDIFVESTPGKGSCFWFRLPFLKGESGKPDLANQEIDVFEDLEGIKVLVVEDNAINRLVAKKFLENWNVEVLEAEDGKMGVEIVKENELDIVLMDLQMPVMNGYDATKEIKSMENGKYKDLPVMALTASILSGIQDEIDQAGLDGFLIKPFKAPDLYNLIKTHVRKEK